MCVSMFAVQEGLRILLQQRGLGSVTLHDVLLALIDGAQATISQGEPNFAIPAGCMQFC